MGQRKNPVNDMWAVLVLFIGFGAAMLGGIFYMMRLQGGAAELQDANPFWQVENVPNGALRLIDGGAPGEVFIAADDAAAVRIERVPCAEVRNVFPPWFSLPDVGVGNCVRLGSAAPFTYVLNLKTATTIPEIWTENYEKTARSLDLSYGGGSSGSGPGSYGSDGRIDPNSLQWAPAPGGGRTSRLARQLGYTIHPKPGRGVDVAVSIEAFYYGDSTQVVFSFRTEQPGQ